MHSAFMIWIKADILTGRRGIPQKISPHIGPILVTRFKESFSLKNPNISTFGAMNQFAVLIWAKISISSDKKNGSKRQHSSKNSTQIESKLEHVGPFTITKEFNAILGVAAMHDQSFIVVERPWIDICRSLPPAFQKKKFGK